MTEIIHIIIYIILNYEFLMSKKKKICQNIIFVYSIVSQTVVRVPLRSLCISDGVCEFILKRYKKKKKL